MQRSAVEVQGGGSESVESVEGVEGVEGVEDVEGVEGVKVERLGKERKDPGEEDRGGPRKGMAATSIGVAQDDSYGLTAAQVPVAFERVLQCQASAVRLLGITWAARNMIGSKDMDKDYDKD
eukprot:Skav202010  [mRNA]  locus=scaffold1829:158237:158801:+ [translate_table: standard]